jgi:putative acetyltransferase
MKLLISANSFMLIALKNNCFYSLRINMKVRPALSSDTDALKTLFYNTVRRVNCRDYSPKQIDVWSSAVTDEQLWQSRVQSGGVYVVEEETQVVGFASLHEGGYIGMLFCHSHYQGKGVGTLLLNHLEQVAQSLGLDRVYSEVSITAQPFFQHRGFRIVQPQTVKRQGVEFRNFVMEKDLVS